MVRLGGKRPESHSSGRKLSEGGPVIARGRGLKIRRGIEKRDLKPSGMKKRNQ